MSRFDEFDFGQDFDVNRLFEEEARDRYQMDFVKEDTGEYDSWSAASTTVGRHEAPSSGSGSQVGRHESPARSYSSSSTPSYDPSAPDYPDLQEAPPLKYFGSSDAGQQGGYGQNGSGGYSQNYAAGNYGAGGYDAPEQGYQQAAGAAYRGGYGEDRSGYGRSDGYGDDSAYRRGRSARPDYEEYRERYDTGRRKRGIGVPAVILIVVLVLGILIAGFMLLRIAWNYHRDREAYNNLALEAITDLIRRDEEDEEDNAAANASEVPIQVDWNMLRTQNSDVIGWLYCPNTVINYPVVQTPDEEFYLTHGFDKQPNTSGTLFADYNSVAGVKQANFIIYGHNMKDHSMFGTLTNYTDQSYWVQNPIMYYLTPSQNYRVELSCAHIVESTVNNFPTFFSTTAEYQNYLNSISYDCFWINDQAMITDYQLITFSTCSYTSGYNDPRFLVHGILIPVD